MQGAKLPQLERLFLTDAGLETEIIFKRGIDLPCFSSINLMRDPQGRQLLRDYFRDFLELARRSGTGCVLETATWRASPDWAAALGLSPEQLEDLVREAVEMMAPLKAEYAALGVTLVVSGCVGPRGDGYDPGKVMSAAEAERYHRAQAAVMASAGADMISALTMTNIPEAIGVARAAESTGLPAVISFTVETDGRLPTGDTLREAIEAVDAATGAYPAYYMINCAHPTHFADVLRRGGDWTKRIGGLRANASRCSHAELDAMTELDDGDPVELGEAYLELRREYPQLSVLGGCCGTDLRHVTAIADACVADMRAAA